MLFCQPLHLSLCCLWSRCGCTDWLLQLPWHIQAHPGLVLGLAPKLRFGSALKAVPPSPGTTWSAWSLDPVLLHTPGKELIINTYKENSLSNSNTPHQQKNWRNKPLLPDIWSVPSSSIEVSPGPHCTSLSDFQIYRGSFPSFCLPFAP